MKLSKTARAILSITALAWSIPLAQAAEDRLDRDESPTAEVQRDRTVPGRATPFAAGAGLDVANDAASDE